MSKKRKGPFTGTNIDDNPIDYVTVSFSGTFDFSESPQYETNKTFDLPFYRYDNGDVECSEILGVQVNVFNVLNMIGASQGFFHYAMHNATRVVTEAIPASFQYRPVWHSRIVSFLRQGEIDWINGGGRGYIIVRPRTFFYLTMQGFSLSADVEIGGIAKLWYRRCRIGSQTYQWLADQQPEG